MKKYTCDLCFGTGIIELKKIVIHEGKEVEFPYLNKPIRCTKCDGHGKLNWIETIFGKVKK